ncbi:unnamed protein product [Trichogramma brassicae]|uniref:Uncharacterized protein n=1 Tax=Trichogramma brassicae TaxID=86971 RepID=A0A6H5J065_9HYME|nr:unnamed protein product [Trichogramma brassicae]
MVLEREDNNQRRIAEQQRLLEDQQQQLAEQQRFDNQRLEQQLAGLQAQLALRQNELAHAPAPLAAAAVQPAIYRVAVKASEVRSYVADVLVKRSFFYSAATSPRNKQFGPLSRILKALLARWPTSKWNSLCEYEWSEGRELSWRNSYMQVSRHLGRFTAETRSIVTRWRTTGMLTPGLRPRRRLACGYRKMVRIFHLSSSSKDEAGARAITDTDSTSSRYRAKFRDAI